LLCLHAGAGHVYGIDDSAMIDVARESVSRAGLGDRASFIRGRSQQLELPERVDVVVCDHVGCFGFDYGIVELFEDAKRRFLKPAGAMIPTRIAVQVAAVESEQCRQLTQAWCAHGVLAEYRWLRDFSVNTKHLCELAREDLIGTPRELGEIDLREDRQDFCSWTVELHMTRSGMVHGLGGWFDCELAPGVRMTNSPLADEPIRRAQAFLPIGESVQVNAGDRAKVTLMARPGDHLIAWIVEFPASGRRFSHSTWQGMPLSSEDLVRTDPMRVPRLNYKGRAGGIVAAYCDGRRTASEIVQTVLREHPTLLPTPGEIARFVTQVLGRDTE
jgi:hypothetical protein